MNLPLFIARRYFFSRKISGVIHVIALISMLAISVGSFALISILSSFNGFENVVSSLYNAFNADLQITPEKGKYFSLTHEKLHQLKSIKGVAGFTRVIEENILATYGKQQVVCSIKGIEPSYLHTSGIDTMIFSGNAVLNRDGINYAILGSGVAVHLNMQTAYDMEPLQLVLPSSGAANSFSVMNPKPFTRKAINVGGVFSVEQEFDSKYILIPYYFAADFTQKQGKCTSIEMVLKDEINTDEVRSKVSSIIGSGFIIKDRYEQQPNLYRVMKIEKLAVYLILTFIMLIAAFNLVGALLMLAIEKKKDMMVLMSMGMEKRNVSRVIFYEGLLLSVAGGLAGVILGGIACWLQQKYGFIKISDNPESTFVISAYPIGFRFWDFVIVPVTIIALGVIASYYPAKISSRKISVTEINT